MNNDVCTEILLHLPVESLLRFRAVCKFWCYVIDSPSFRELHINNNNNNVSDDMVRLEFYFNNGQLRVLHNTKPLLTYKSDQLMGYEFSSYLDHPQGQVRLHGPVMGLACIYHTQLRKPIAVCNPCLGQLKLLPPITTSSYSTPYRPCEISQREVAIGFDEDYKVAQLLLCRRHSCLHGLMYSRKTDSWKDLAGVNGNLIICSISPMKQACENGRFAHWYVVSATGYSRAEAYILSLDMKNEVFQTIRSQGRWNSADIVVTYVAEDEHSFWRLDLPRDPSRNRVKIYRSSSGESRYGRRFISWAPLTNVQFPFYGGLGLWRRPSCVFFKYWNYMFVFDYRASKYSYRLCYNHFPVLFKHRCSFVSLENVS